MQHQSNLMINIARTNVEGSPIVSGRPIAETVDAMQVNRSMNFGTLNLKSPEMLTMQNTVSGTSRLNSTMRRA